MNKLKIALGLTAAFGLMACGSDSNSTAPEPSPAISSDSQSGVSSDSQDALSSAGTTVNSSNSNADVASSNSTEAPVACGFKMTDTEWSYSLKSTDARDNTSGTVEISYKIDGTNATRTETAKVSGGSTSMACRLMGTDHQIKDINDDGSLVTDQYCEGGSMIRVTTKKLTNIDVQKLFAAESQTCKVVNKLAEDATPVVELTKSCGFKATDAEWSYTYTDEGKTRKRTYVPSVSDGYVYSYNDEITVMSYAACKMAHPLEESTSFCTEEGYVSRGSSGFPKEDPIAYYTTALKSCTDDTGMPADTSSAPEVTSSSSEETASSSSVENSGDEPAVGSAMTCLSKGFAETLCFIAPATATQAAFKTFCDGEMGTMGTTCPEGKTLECVGPKTGNTIYYYDDAAAVMGCEFMLGAND